MTIERQNIITGKWNKMELDVTLEQLHQWQYGRKLIQNVMPHLTATEREFLITGMSPEEQDKFYSPLKDEDDEEISSDGEDFWSDEQNNVR